MADWEKWRSSFLSDDLLWEFERLHMKEEKAKECEPVRPWQLQADGTLLPPSTDFIAGKKLGGPPSSWILNPPTTLTPALSERVLHGLVRTAMMNNKLSPGMYVTLRAARPEDRAMRPSDMYGSGDTRTLADLPSGQQEDFIIETRPTQVLYGEEKGEERSMFLETRDWEIRDPGNMVPRHRMHDDEEDIPIRVEVRMSFFSMLPQLVKPGIHDSEVSIAFRSHHKNLAESQTTESFQLWKERVGAFMRAWAPDREKWANTYMPVYEGALLGSANISLHALRNPAGPSVLSFPIPLPMAFTEHNMAPVFHLTVERTPGEAHRRTLHAMCTLQPEAYARLILGAFVRYRTASLTSGAAAAAAADEEGFPRPPDVPLSMPLVADYLPTDDMLDAFMEQNSGWFAWDMVQVWPTDWDHEDAQIMNLL